MPDCYPVSDTSSMPARDNTAVLGEAIGVVNRYQYSDTTNTYIYTSNIGCSLYSDSWLSQHH